MTAVPKWDFLPFSLSSQAVGAPSASQASSDRPLGPSRSPTALLRLDGDDGVLDVLGVLPGQVEWLSSSPSS